jgi:glycosyltransferase involved in cell wall biosynthesis
MDRRQRHLRLLAVQTTSSMSSEMTVFQTLLKSLQPPAREAGISVDVLLVQGVDRKANGENERGPASLFRRIPNVTVHELNVGKLGQHDSSRVDRAMKIRDLVNVQLAKKRLLARAYSYQPHVVYSAQQIWDLRIATPLARTLACPQVVHLHYNVGPALGTGVVETIRNASMVIAVSKFIRDDAIAHGVEPGRAHALYNSTEVPPAQSPHDRLVVRRDVRAELGLPEDALLIGMVGRLTPSKGQQQLLEAMLPALKRDPYVHLVLVGTEYPARNGMSDQIWQTARGHNVLSQVHLVGHRLDVPRILDALDVFAHPSRLEPFSLAILEAMAHGLPVVAWREGGPAELVSDNECGLLAEPLDINGLSQALRTLIMDECLRVAMGKMARERALSVFSPAVAAASFLSLLETVAKRERCGTHATGNEAIGLGNRSTRIT